MRNPAVSPWASLMVCAYPFIEVIYSMLRRYIARKGLGSPDSQHFHSLIGSQVIRRHFGNWPKTLQNASVAPVIWLFAAAIAWVAVYFRESTTALVLSLVAVAVAYHLGYRLLARRHQDQQNVAKPTAFKVGQ